MADSADRADAHGISDTVRESLGGPVARELAAYRRQHWLSVDHQEDYWALEAARLAWDEPFSAVRVEDIEADAVRWFEDGKLNAYTNAVARHVAAGRGEDVALVAVDRAGHERVFTFAALQTMAERAAAALHTAGLRHGDRVGLYLNVCPEMLALLLGAAHQGIVAVPLSPRISGEFALRCLRDAGVRLVLLGMEGTDRYQAQREHLLTALDMEVHRVVVGSLQPATSWEAWLDTAKTTVPPVPMPAEAPLTILYGKAGGAPRGSIFATGGSLVQAASFHARWFVSLDDEKPMAVSCAIDLSAAAGQFHGVWGPLLNGSPIVLGQLTVHDKSVRRLNHAPSPLCLLTSPTRLQNLKGPGPTRVIRVDEPQDAVRFDLVAATDGTLMPRLIDFTGQALTHGVDRVINLWTQNESGTALVATLPGTACNPKGALGLPVLGVEPLVVNGFGQTCQPNESGTLVVRGTWPGMIRDIWNQPDRYRALYRLRIPGFFPSDDGARVDPDGFFWFMGRQDDMANVDGVPFSTSEAEAILLSHPGVDEAAVLALAGQGQHSLIAFAVADVDDAARLETELADLLETRLGEFARPERLCVVSELPHTRTGKVVRRILRKIVTGELSSQDDLSHLANPGAVPPLLARLQP